MIITEEEKKEEGMQLSATANSHNLDLARQLADIIGRQRRFCSVEDVRDMWGGKFPTGNWAGSIFKDRKKWSFHEYRKAEHLGSHARIVSIWRFLGM